MCLPTKLGQFLKCIAFRGSSLVSHVLLSHSIFNICQRKVFSCDAGTSKVTTAMCCNYCMYMNILPIPYISYIFIYTQLHNFDIVFQIFVKIEFLDINFVLNNISLSNTAKKMEGIWKRMFYIVWLLYNRNASGHMHGPASCVERFYHCSIR